MDGIFVRVVGICPGVWSCLLAWSPQAGREGLGMSLVSVASGRQGRQPMFQPVFLLLLTFPTPFSLCLSARLSHLPPPWEGKDLYLMPGSLEWRKEKEKAKHLLWPFIYPSLNACLGKRTSPLSACIFILNMGLSAPTPTLPHLPYHTFLVLTTRQTPLFLALLRPVLVCLLVAACRSGTRTGGNSLCGTALPSTPPSPLPVSSSFSLFVSFPTPPFLLPSFHFDIYF